MGVNGNLEESGGSSFPDCPRCGESVAMMTVIGPTEGFTSPCGCRVMPGTLESE